MLFLVEGYDESNVEGRILRAAALAAVKSGGGWMKNLKNCMECFGWCRGSKRTVMLRNYNNVSGLREKEGGR